MDKRRSMDESLWSNSKRALRGYQISYGYTHRFSFSHHKTSQDSVPSASLQTAYNFLGFLKVHYRRDPVQPCAHTLTDNFPFLLRFSPSSLSLIHI